MTNGSNIRDMERGFLRRLLHDSRGNTLALIAAVMIPLLGLLGGGIDMSRLYLTKTRLQHACDAGALAGRKAMANNAWTTTGTGNSNSIAVAMFDGNFKQGDYGTGTRTRTYSEANGSVTGTATAVVPMAIMKIFGITTRTLTVNCTAMLAIPNTDVMFVLDVTGSMNCQAGDTSCTNNGEVPATDAKILGLRRAVLCFYEALMKVNTAEVCGSDPTATTYTGTAQIRIGFVPYSVNVNVGKLLPNAFLADEWTYQTRVPNFTTTETAASTQTGTPTLVSDTTGAYGSWSGTTTGTYNRSCDGRYGDDVRTGNEGSPYNQTSVTSGNTVTVTYSTNTTVTQTDGSETLRGSWLWGYSCDYSVRSRTATRVRQYTRIDVVTPATSVRTWNNWTYTKASLTVSGLKAGGSTWNNSVMLPLGTTEGNDTSVGWDGCIEERKTVQNSDGDPSDEWNPIPTAAWDMDIDMIPSSTDPDTQWGPMLPNATWTRQDNNGNWTMSSITTTSNRARNMYYACPAEARLLQQWDTAAPFETYVNSLNAIGNTYHDIGMIWGARFISPTGIFATQNTNKTRIERHIIFMTDGDTQSYPDDYAAYGVHWWNRRQTTYAPDNATNNAVINAHLAGLCTAIKNKNITLWVIGFGGTSGINSTTTARLQACATTGKYFAADDTTALISRFRQIASDISELRLTQ